MSDSDETTQNDLIDKVIDQATTGDPTEASRLLWPLMLGEAHRDQAMFALAFCFEKAQNFATAHYLYEEIALHYPEFTVAVNRQQACRSVVEEKGLIEDFDDMGHRSCSACTLRYRNEYSLCPYCGTMKDTQKASVKKKPAAAHKPQEEEAPLPGWDDPTFLDAIQEMGRDAADRIQDVVESDTMKKVSDTVTEASKATAKKAKEWTEGDAVQDLKKRSVKLGDEVLNKAQQLSEKPALRDLAQKIDTLSTVASDKVKQVMEKDTTQEAKAKAQRFGKKILRNIREALDPDQKDR